MCFRDLNRNLLKLCPSATNISFPSSFQSARSVLQLLFFIIDQKSQPYALF